MQATLGRRKTLPVQQQQQPSLAQRTAGALINVGVLIRYADMSINQGRFRWPSSITEREALAKILETQSNRDLQDIVQIVMNQVPRPGVPRIAWLDTPPHGKYAMNQDMYGKGGLQDQIRQQQQMSSASAYNPDMDDIQYEGSLADFLSEQLSEKAAQEEQETLRDAPLRYDPSIL